MSAAYQDQYLEQGTTFSSQITLDGSNGAAYNLYGFSVNSQAKKSYYSSNAVLQFTSTVSDAANGIITLAASAANTANIPSGKLVYDVVITDSGGNVTRVLEGRIFVSPGVTGIKAIAPGSPSGTNTIVQNDE